MGKYKEEVIDLAKNNTVVNKVFYDYFKNDDSYEDCLEKIILLLEKQNKDFFDHLICEKQNKQCMCG